MSTRQRVLSGMRPTGQLHIGHLVGALANWRELQARYECFFMVADWHALMSEYDQSPASLRSWTYANLADWLAAGIDPARSVIFRQSDVPEHAELFSLLAILTPLGWVERVPTYKEQLRELAGRDLATYGFLGYPVLQTADILLYKAHCVPVGEDQLPHLELAREIVRRVHHFAGRVLFPEPEALLTQAPKLLGIDGRKMSKSYGNAIELGAPEGEIRAAAQKMFTDPTRIRMSDPGHPETCNVCQYWKVFAPERAGEMWEGCRTATRGCAQNKRELGDVLADMTRPFRESRERLQSGGGEQAKLEAILQAGAVTARAVAQQTMREVKAVFGLGASVSGVPPGSRNA
ncbi:MAG TPA: tryptophan--tRNA ligase [bacterium]